MTKMISFLLLSFSLSFCASAQPILKDPYTGGDIADGVYIMEGANDSNTAKMAVGIDGQTVHMSDSYGMQLKREVAATEYTDATHARTGYYTRISQHKDYALTMTRLVVDLGEGAVVTNKDLTKGIFKVLCINKSDKTIRNITGLSVTDKEGYPVESGRYVTIDLDFSFDADSENAYSYIVTLNKDLGKYSKGSKFIQQGRTIIK